MFRPTPCRGSRTPHRHAAPHHNLQRQRQPASPTTILYPYVPEMIRFYPRPRPISARAHLILRRPEDKDYSRPPTRARRQRVHVAAASMLIGPAATRAEIDLVRKQIIASPERYIGQPRLPCRPCQTFADHNLDRLHIDLRPFVLSVAEISPSSPGVSPASPCETDRSSSILPGGGHQDTWCWKLRCSSVPPILHWMSALHRTARASRAGRRTLSNVPSTHARSPTPDPVLEAPHNRLGLEAPTESTMPSTQHRVSFSFVSLDRLLRPGSFTVLASRARRRAPCSLADLRAL